MALLAGQPCLRGTMGHHVPYPTAGMLCMLCVHVDGAALVQGAVCERLLCGCLVCLLDGVQASVLGHMFGGPPV